MKWINFKKKVGETNIGTADKPIFEPVLQEMSVEYSPANDTIIKQIAHNSDYEIVDDGQPDPADTPSQLDVIEAQVTYTALMTDTLLEV
jgi:hypothetical protein